MGLKKVFGVVVLVMAYGLAVTGLCRAQISSTCNGYEPLLSQCVAALVIGSSTPPTPHCCDGARVAFERANNPQAIKNLCSCLADEAARLYFNPINLARLPVACKIKLPFSINQCVFGRPVEVINHM